VAKGTVIARLDSSVLKASYDAALAQYKLADVTYRKQKKVFEQQAISELQLQTLEYQRDAAKAGADLAEARFERTIIRSPFTGILNDRYFEVGEMVAPGAPLAHVVSNGRLKVRAGVPERFAGRLNTGDAVSFTIDAFPGEKFNGKISFVAAAINPDNRTIPVEVTIQNTGGKLKPDMIVTLNITLKAFAEAIVIPSDYIQQVDIGRFVAYVENNGIAEERVLEIASSSQGLANISKGLKEGDRLITVGFQSVAQGQKVSVK
jgi:membrane fusion protein, multidrug efflux system